MTIECTKCPKCGKYFVKYVPKKLEKKEKNVVCIFCGNKLTLKDVKIY